MDLQEDYVTVVENRPIMSVKYGLPVPVFHFWPKLTYSAARSLCDSSARRGRKLEGARGHAPPPNQR